MATTHTFNLGDKVISVEVQDGAPVGIVGKVVWFNRDGVTVQVESCPLTPGRGNFPILGRGERWYFRHYRVRRYALSPFETAVHDYIQRELHG